MATTPSSDLEWLLIRRSNCFIRKQTSTGVVFSAEPGNLRNLNSKKYSGVISTKNVHVIPSGESGITLKMRTAESPYTVSKSHKSKKLRGNAGRKTAGSVYSSTHGAGYRPDLSKAAVQRASAILKSQKVPKEAPVTTKSARAPKKTAKKVSKSKAEVDDDDDVPPLV